MNNVPAKLVELAEKSKYSPDAYIYVNLGITGVQNKVEKTEGRRRHITGQELYNYLLTGATELFGFLAKTVLNEWGIYQTEDFGEIVFDMVDNGLMGKCDDDSKSDFNNGPDFEQLETDYKITIPQRNSYGK